ncbi:MAG: glutamate N-acetyltransferase / amino-acid N-acetyltransferase [Candidatus Saganbacteria bacterium]|uniref:Arginine biosynthesis bifunctional protein ArgJ n=1 Tax=Candidatus Saganbacteria bacterium TaxID=2575572 RepID=A0A833NSA9_UNCSA|nr:MAG: glutamate N-acetyltransferase / amino-acid N-acetyltransferase [Candidatus Saganbacteria bacterium]
MKQTGITAPEGFLAGGIACGIKKSGKPDLAVIYSEVPAVAAGVFTANQYKAAPIIVSMEQIKSKSCRAIISNAGNANCGTGKKGIEDAKLMVKTAAEVFNINSKQILVTSTGSIGKQLPMDKIVGGIKNLKATKDGGSDMAQAILTTDTRKKEIALDMGGYTIAGVAKGSGMIHPNMATMHCFITTDAKIEKSTLQKLLKKAVENSFNMITVDQCMSTNDCVFVLANGMSGVKPKENDFYTGLEKVCKYLAIEIARDGEGATQLIIVNVSGAKNEKEAKTAARAIAGSDLLKCAVYGKDYNLGRIYAAVGATSVKMDAGKIKADMKFGEKETIIICDLGAGYARAQAWGCDMTEGYVKINADYHT